MPELNSVGDRIRHARNIADLSQPQLADASGVPQRTISSIEGGSAERSFDILRNICRALGVTADWVLGLSDYPRGIAPDSWLVDEDAVAMLRAGGPVDETEAWAVAIPRRPRIVSSTEFVRLRAELEPRTRKVQRKRP